MNIITINYQQIQFFKGSWFKAILDKSLWKNLLAKMQPENSNNQFSRYDLILANPPYIAENSEFLQNLTFEPQTALVAKEDGIADIKNIVVCGPRRLDHRLRLLLAGVSEDRISYAEKEMDAPNKLKLFENDNVFVLYGTDSISLGMKVADKVLGMMKKGAGNREGGDK